MAKGGARERWYDRLDAGMRLPPEVAFAQKVLAEAGYRQVGDPRKWVPFSTLWSAYREACAFGQTEPCLNEKRFGIALKTIYPSAGRSRRRWQGAYHYAVTFMDGPGAVTSPEPQQYPKLKGST